jgi:kynurenine formamidase
MTRPIFKKRFFYAATIGLICMAAIGTSQEEKWYPSQWGPDDQRGAANRLTPQKVIEAKELITSGKVYPLGRIYEAEMPLFGTRHFSLHLPQTFGPLGKNKAVWHDEIISGELGQVGTQFDGLGHAGIDDRFYNGFTREEIATPYGLAKLGVENVGPIVTRGVLIDVARFKGVDCLEDSYEITVSDLRDTLQKQGTEVHSGDVVIIHTGWGALWNDHDRFSATEPGIGLDAALFLVEQQVVLVGSDNFGVEVVPNPDPDLAFPVHQLLLTKNGIHLLENLVTADLASESVYEFAFIFAPVPFKGATGSPGNPIAIR